MVRRLRPTRVVVRFRVRSFAVLWVCIVLRSATHTFCSSLASISDSPINFARYLSQVPPYHPGKVSEHVWIIIIQFFAFYLCALFIRSLVRGRGLDAMIRIRTDPRNEDVSRVNTFDSIILTFSAKVKLDWCTTLTGSSSSHKWHKLAGRKVGNCATFAYFSLHLLTSCPLKALLIGKK